MGQGNRGLTARWRGWLALAALLACMPAFARDLEVARLPYPADAREVIAGAHDAGFQVREGDPVIREESHAPTWWRVRTPAPVDSRAEPQLVLEGPYLTQVEAWVPGAASPTRHAIYGEHADTRYAARALAVALPRGLQAGEAVYLRVTAPAAVPMALSVRSRDQVHRADLAHVAWRTAILSSMLVLGLLALAFWAGVRERSYGFLALTLGFSVLYIAAMGGEARAVPVLDALFGRGPQGARVVACLGVVTSNVFVRMYLDLRRQAPGIDRVLRWLTAAMALLAVLNFAFEHGILAQAGNIGLVLSALAVFAAAAVSSLRGSRAARFVLVSWLPLIVFSILKAAQLMGAFDAGDWLSHALAASFALAGLLLTIGLSDKLVQLRRDRDHASLQANVDPLTGALSRAAVERRLAQEVEVAHRTGRPLCVAFVDIDRFKAINDNHGHHVGDGCLRSISQRVRNRLRTQDVLGRYGGDELLALMPDTPLAEGLARCEQLRATVNCRPLSIDGLLVQGTLSVGVAQLRAGDQARELLARADAALYASKAAGRDRVSSETILPPELQPSP